MLISYFCYEKSNDRLILKYINIEAIKISKIIIKQKMEEKSIIDSSLLQMSASDWKVKHNLYQTFRNHRQLENRISIL